MLTNWPSGCCSCSLPVKTWRTKTRGTRLKQGMQKYCWRLSLSKICRFLHGQNFVIAVLIITTFGIWQVRFSGLINSVELTWGEHCCCDFDFSAYPTSHRRWPWKKSNFYKTKAPGENERTGMRSFLRGLESNLRPRQQLPPRPSDWFWTEEGRWFFWQN